MYKRSGFSITDCELIGKRRDRGLEARGMRLSTDIGTSR